jgi:hypothetical protein
MVPQHEAYLIFDPSAAQTKLQRISKMPSYTDMGQLDTRCEEVFPWPMNRAPGSEL